MISYVGNGKGKFGPRSNNSYDFYTYMMQISLFDSKINEGISCTDYEKLGMLDT